MFITKTMNETVEEQFDLIDSICESYEDLIQINDTLVHLDIKEQELLHTESVELDTFREDAMDKAKEMLENFINKLKIRYQAFMKWVNKQIINLFKNQLEKYLSKNKDKFNKALAWFKETNKTPSGKANYASRYLHKAVVKNNKVVSLNEFIDGASDVLYDILDRGELGIYNIDSNVEPPKIDIVKIYKDKVEKEVGKFETITTDNNKAFIFPIAAFNDFETGMDLMEKVVGKSGIFDKTEDTLKRMTAAGKVSNTLYRTFTWRYIQFTKMVNAFLSMCRRYFMTCLISASSIIKIYEDNRDKE